MSTSLLEMEISDEFLASLLEIEKQVSYIPKMKHQIQLIMKKLNVSQTPIDDEIQVQINKQIENDVGSENDNDEEENMDEISTEDDTDDDEKSVKNQGDELEECEKDEEEFTNTASDIDDISEIDKKSHEFDEEEDDDKEDDEDLAVAKASYSETVFVEVSGKAIHLTEQNMKTIFRVLLGLERKKLELKDNLVRSSVREVLTHSGLFGVGSKKDFTLSDIGIAKILQLYREEKELNLL